jgi:energy-coupling factor transport system ATP-binding protein
VTPILRVENLHYTYPAANGEPVQALRGVSLDVEPGEYVAILGHNGSGKSTLAKHLNALLQPSAGDVWVKQWNTRNRGQWRDIRATVGMVFQTPDNQIVATIVEEDVAFGPENLGVARPDMIRRVDWALDQVGMAAYRHRAPHLLSGGQKQRVCIAGVLAMQPEVIVLDESTAMLDPLGRQEVLETVRRLNREQGVTVVAITHFMREAVEAGRVVVMAEGQIALEGTPRELFRQADQLRALALDVPPATEIARRLHVRYPDFPPDLLTIDEVVEAASRLPHGPVAPDTLAADAAALDPHPPKAAPTETPLVEVEHLVHDYMRDTPLEVRALHDVSLTLYPGEIVGILGHTGSGKSTAVQHLNGLLRAHGGRVVVMGQDLADPKTDVRAVRRQIGLVFQFPEAQLFERFVGDDVAFGPRNQELSAEEIRARVRHAMEAVGLGFEAFKDRMTFSLSGGQMRRVALAGVLALEPRVLVLDEPTAGLDPQGRRQLLDHILGLQAEGITLVMISHNMDELAELCDRLYVIAGGKTVLEGTPGQVFAQAETLRGLGLDVPAATLLAERLAHAGVLPPGAFVYTVDQAEQLLVEWREGSRV